MNIKLAWLSSAVIFLTGAFLPQSVMALDCPELVRSTEQIETAGYSHGILWKLESAEGKKSSLLGTIHLGDPRVTDLPQPVVLALNRSGSFGMEVVFDVDGIMMMSKAMNLAKGKSLGGMLDSALFNGTAKLLERYGVATHAAQNLKPWAAFTALSLPPAQPAVPLDMFLMASAQRLNKPVFGLESIEEQIAVFDALSDSDQVELLRHAVCHYDEFQADVDTMIEHYLARDLGAIMQMALRYSSPLQDRFLDLLLWQRNRRMAARMLPHLQEGGAFIAIGVLHLPGSGGVLDILSSHGYIIESVH